VEQNVKSWKKLIDASFCRERLGLVLILVYRILGTSFLRLIQANSGKEKEISERRISLLQEMLCFIKQKRKDTVKLFPWVPLFKYGVGIITFEKDVLTLLFFNF